MCVIVIVFAQKMAFLYYYKGIILYKAASKYAERLQTLAVFA